MNFLHRFLPQPCFDNASAEGGRAGGPGGVNRTSTGARSGGIMSNSGGGYQETAQGIPGYGTAQEGRSFNAAQDARNAASRSSGSSGGGGGAPRATVTVAPPVRTYAPPVQTYAPPPAPMPAPAVAPPAMATPKATAPIGPSGYASLDALAAQKMGVPTSDIQSFQSAPTPAAPSRSMSPSTRSTPAQAAAARSVGAQAAAQRAGQAVSATPSGRAGGVGTPGVGGGFGPSVSNAAAKSDRGLPSVGGGGGISGGRANAGSLGGMGNAANVGVSSNVAGKSDRGVPGLNSRSDMAGLIGRQSFGGSSSMAQNNPAQSMPGSVSDLTDAQISGTIRDMIAGRQSSLFSGISPVGSFATNRPTTAAMARQEAMQGLPSARGYSQPTMSATPTTGAKAITDRLNGSLANSMDVQNAVRGLDIGRPNYSGFTPPDQVRANAAGFGTIGSPIPGADQVQGPQVGNNFYSDPATPGAYPSVFSPEAENAFTDILTTIANPPSGLVSLAGAAYGNKSGRAQDRQAGTNRGGNSKSNTKERNRVKKAIAEAIAPKKSGWSPYTGSSRFANWTPIMKALMG